MTLSGIRPKMTTTTHHGRWNVRRYIHISTYIPSQLLDRNDIGKQRDYIGGELFRTKEAARARQRTPHER